LLRLQGLPVLCAYCGNDVDPLRAPKVSHRANVFCYYCSSDCWARRAEKTPARFDQQIDRASSSANVVGSEHISRDDRRIEASVPPSEAVESTATEVRTVDPLARQSEDFTPGVLPPLVDFVGEPSLAQMLEMLGINDENPQPHRRESAVSTVTQRRVAVASVPSDNELTVLLAALAAALLAGALLWLGGWIAITGAGVMAIAAIALGLHSLWQLREKLLWLACAPPLLGAGLAVLRALTQPRAATSLALAASVSVTSSIAAFAVRRAMRRARHQLRAQRERLPRTARVSGGKIMEVHSLRASDEIVVEAGETVGVDGVILSGKAEIVTPAGMGEIRAGQPILAGSVLRSGALTILATHAGDDVAMMKLVDVVDSSKQQDGGANRVWTLSIGSVLAALVMALVVSTGYRSRDFLACAALALGALPMTVAFALATVPWDLAVLSAISYGVFFRDRDSLSAAARVRALVLCVKGTLTRGEYELAEIVSLGKFDERSLLALAAGAEQAAQQPVMSGAFVRAAKQKDLRVESIRRPVLSPGCGVTAATAMGAQVLLGTRALFIAQSVAVASAEEVARSIEAQGRHAVFLALDGVVEGVFGLDDPPRQEARAAVQRLMDHGLAVALVGGESAGTLSAIGLAIDVGHIRAEVALEDRAAAVRSIAEVAGRVAVAGRTPLDDGALGAADLSIAVEAAGGAGAETAVALSGDDLRDVVQTLVLARAAQKQADRVVIVAVIAAVVAMCGALLAPTLSLAVLVLWVVSALGASMALRTVEAIAD
jgi:cation transport ATPase